MLETILDNISGEVVPDVNRFTARDCRESNQTVSNLRTIVSLSDMKKYTILIGNIIYIYIYIYTNWDFTMI